MEKMKLNLYIATFSYGGNGGIPSTVPQVGEWLLKIRRELQDDPRIDKVFLKDYCDTPITMTRNKSVVDARAAGADLLLMIDSDCFPDIELGSDPLAKPFWTTSFEFIYENWAKGPHVVAAPYCGMPPHENVFAFYWGHIESDCPDDAGFSMSQYSRHEAMRMAGIQEAAAGPTGLILFDMRAFELTEPKKVDYGEPDVLGFGGRGVKRKSDSWFYYEWDGDDPYQAEKASTEDVTATRDMSIVGTQLLGYNPFFINWDAWPGHWKRKCVRKPRGISANFVGDRMREALDENLHSGMQQVDFESEYAKEVDFSDADRAGIDPAAPGGDYGSVATVALGGLTKLYTEEEIDAKVEWLVDEAQGDPVRTAWVRSHPCEAVADRLREEAKADLRTPPQNEPKKPPVIPEEYLNFAVDDHPVTPPPRHGPIAETGCECPTCAGANA